MQTALALLAATVLGMRTVRTATGQTAPDTDTQAPVLAALAVGATLALVVAGAVLVLAGRRRAAVGALAVAVVLELTLLSAVAAPPRLVTALPLAMALALFLLGRGTPATPGGSGALRRSAGWVGLLLMVPVGLLYLLSGLAVPSPALFAMYLLYGVLLAVAALLARRRSWWAVGVPPLAVALWFLLIWIGGEQWGWQA